MIGRKTKCPNPASMCAIFCALLFMGLLPSVTNGARGDLLENRLVQSGTLADMKTFLNDVKKGHEGGPFMLAVLNKIVLEYGLKHYFLKYESEDAFGNYIESTAALLVPVEDGVANGKQPTGENKPTLLYNHATIATDAEVPSNSKLCIKAFRNSNTCSFSTSPVSRAAAWAAMGYVVILPDYEKLGAEASDGHHPYCQKDSFVTSTEDLLFAVRKTGLAFDNRLAVAGYSEGGYAALAIHRGLELGNYQQRSHGFSVVASFPQAGPIDWKYQVDNTLEHYAKGSYDSYWYVPYTIVGALEYRNRLDLYDSVFLSPYNESVRAMYDRKTSAQQIESQLPQNGKTGNLFQPRLVQLIESGQGVESLYPPDLYEIVVQKNILLDHQWSPNAPVFFCSGTEDEQVPVQNTKNAIKRFKESGAQVHIDFFAGNHGTNAKNCLLALTRYMSTLDWDLLSQEKDFMQFSLRQPLISATVWGIIAAVVCFLTAGTVWSSLLAKYPNRIYSPTELWLTMFVKAPFFVIIVSVGAAAGLSVAGLHASNWSMNVDTDFGNYLEADSELKRIENALETARGESTYPSPNPEEGRRLKEAFAWPQGAIKFWSLDLFYQLKQPRTEDGELNNIFSPNALQEIRQIENDLKAFDGYDKYCYRAVAADGAVIGDGNCTRPDSVVNIFFPSINITSKKEVKFIYDGKGELTDIEKVLRLWVKKGIFWFSDRYFNGANMTSQYTRSKFRGGVPLKGHTDCIYHTEDCNRQMEETEKYLISLYHNFLVPLNDKTEHVLVSWRESRYLTTYEVNEHLFHDAAVSIGSFLFVALFVYLHIGSVWLTIAAISGILLSFPMAYWLFFVVAGIEKMMILNFVSLFLIMGIGADDVFVFFDAHKQIEALMGDDAPLSDRFKATYRRAFASMLITTTTTCGSFYSNMFSTVRVVREFGLFMGTVTLFNFINVMTIFPAAVVIYEQCHRCSCKRPAMSPSQRLAQMQQSLIAAMRGFRRNRALSDARLPSCERIFRVKVSPFIYRFRWALLSFAFIVTGSFAIAGMNSFRFVEGPPIVFLEHINLGRIESLQRATFGATSAADLEVVLETFPQYSDVVEKTCPGILSDGVITCSGNGECDAKTDTCKCNTGYSGLGCETAAKIGVVEMLGPTNLFYSAFDGGEYTRDFQFQNTGDYDIGWSIKSLNGNDTLPSWLSFQGGFPRVGLLAKRKEKESGAFVYSKQRITFVATVQDKAEGNVDAFSIILTGDNDEGIQIKFQITMTPYPSLANFQLERDPLGSPRCASVPAVAFQSSIKAYSASLNYLCSSVFIVATVENKDRDNVVLLVNGTNSSFIKSASNVGIFKHLVTVDSTIAPVSFTNKLSRTLTESDLSQTEKGESLYSFQLTRRQLVLPGKTVISSIVCSGTSCKIYNQMPQTTGDMPVSGFLCFALQGNSVERNSSNSTNIVEFNSLNGAIEYQFACKATTLLGSGPMSPPSPTEGIKPAASPPFVSNITWRRNADDLEVTISKFQNGGATVNYFQCQLETLTQQNDAPYIVFENAMSQFEGNLSLQCRLVNDRSATADYFNVRVPNFKVTTTPTVGTTTQAPSTTTATSTTKLDPITTSTESLTSVTTTTLVPTTTPSQDTTTATVTDVTTTTVDSATTTADSATTTAKSSTTTAKSSTTTAESTTTTAESTTAAQTTTTATAETTTVAATTATVATTTTGLPKATNVSTTTVVTTTPSTTSPVFTPEQTDATLSSLSFTNPTNNENVPLSNPFDSLLMEYNLTVSASKELLNLQATTNSSLSFKLINGGSNNVIRLDYVLHPQGYTTVLIDVTAASGNSQQYTVHIYRIPLTCNPLCSSAGGVCNGFEGNCKCKTSEGFSGSHCNIYCPSSCSGHGSCNATMQQCECASSYAGPACASRVCPSCLNNGVCVKADWSCKCTPLWQGNRCAEKACVNGCNDVGECNDGVCACFPGHKGEDCSVQETTKIPLKYAIEVQLVFGIVGYNAKNHSRPIMYPNFDLAASESQAFLREVCMNSKNISRLSVRPEIKCWIEQFGSAVTTAGYTFPLSPGMFSSALDLFLSAENGVALGAYKKDLGTVGGSDVIEWTSLRMKINVDKTLNFQALLPIRGYWKEYVDEISKAAPVTLGPALLVSKTFTESDTEMGIVSSTVVSFLVSNGICLLCILFFTVDWRISGFTVLTINMIVVTLMGLLFSVANYPFGAIEAVGVTIFVGMSVDYSLHLGHAYNHSPGRTTKSRVRDALSTIGVSIFGGAITTAGASFFLLWCRIFLFVQLGVMMLSNTVTAFVYTLACLSACLAIIGPVKKCVCLRFRPASSTIRPEDIPAATATDVSSQDQNSYSTERVPRQGSDQFTYDAVYPEPGEGQ